jgi:hypothetical protein
MAAKRNSSAQSVDWYLISIDRLKQIGLVVFLVLLALGIWWFLRHERGSPRSNAESAIADARQAINTLAASKDLTSHRPEYDRAQRKLDQASASFASAKYAEAQTVAVESQTISRTAMSGGTDEETDAHFITIEGDVQYQKSSSSEWKRADLRSPLVNGDWVKTGGSASAELMFQNGSMYTVGPNALLEIYSSINPATSRKTNAVQMQVGSVEVATTLDPSTVKTPGSQVVIDSDSSTQIGVDRAKATSVVAMKGSASVTSTAGGEPVTVGAGEKVSATAAGTLSGVKKLIMPPALARPADNQVFIVAPDTKIDFEWQPVPGAASYQLQISRSHLFVALEVNSKREKATAAARGTSEGTFYWRVASIGADGEVGPFSQFRRFRVSSGGSKGPATAGTDTTPPALTLKAPFNIGGQFYIIEGTTEPGATVFINEEEVDVESNGHFKKLVSFNKVGPNAVIVKAVDPAGNQTVQSQTVLVEE